MKLLVINGPNLNLIGFREPNMYGDKTYKDLVCFIKKEAKLNGLNVKVIQTNYEGKIIDLLHKSINKYQGIIINPGALTHYSYSIFDAIKSVNIKTVEVHLTDISKREDFRKISVIKDACVKTFMGKHFDSYKEAIMYFAGEENV
ncbi:MAG: type II 3-dehydroquinate dehydratase [Bacilli bacterium]